MTEFTLLRDRVCKLARKHSATAFKLARAITNPSYRAQALAWVARYSPKSDVGSVADLSLQAARECDDAYQRVASGGWSIRALVERGLHETARQELKRLLAQCADIKPPSSRSEALLILLQAAFHLGRQDRVSIVTILLECANLSGHWRADRNIKLALQMIAGTDPELAHHLAAVLKDDQLRAGVARALSEKKTVHPRAFFW